MGVLGTNMAGSEKDRKRPPLADVAVPMKRRLVQPSSSYESDGIRRMRPADTIAVNLERRQNRNEWPLHFINPNAPLRPTTNTDFLGVLAHLRWCDVLDSHVIHESVDAIEVCVWIGDTVGTLHYYPARHGRMNGNVRLLPQPPKSRTLRMLLKEILASAWFLDATEKTPKQMTILPPICTPRDNSISDVIREIGKSLGTEGRRQIAEYLDHSGVSKSNRTYLEMMAAIGTSSVEEEVASQQSPQPSPEPAGKVPMSRSFTLCLKNWRQLTFSNGGFKVPQMMEGLAEAQWNNADCIISNEIGATTNTCPFEIDEYDFDYEKGDRAVPGQGVGAFLHANWRGKWTVVSRNLNNCRIYLLEDGNLQILVASFYAPHTGHGVGARSKFYSSLAKVWRRAHQAFPKAWRILAGDANLPSVVKHLAGTRTGSESGINKQFCEDFLVDMCLANTAVTEASPTHDRGGVLDLVLIDKRLTIHKCQIGAKGVAASDHRMVAVTIGLPESARELDPMQWRSVNCPC